MLPVVGDGGGGVVLCRLAEQLAVVPPFEPAQLHDQGPEPKTVDAAPSVHKFVVGAAVSVVPLLVPHEPFTGVEMSANDAETFRD